MVAVVCSLGDLYSIGLCVVLDFVGCLHRSHRMRLMQQVTGNDTGKTGTTTDGG